MPLVFYLIILFLSLEVLSFFYSRLFGQLSILRFSIILGIFLHEFSHYLACKLVLAPVKKFHIGYQGGYIIHGKSKIPVLGGIVISLAPLLFGIVFLGIIMYYLNNDTVLIKSLIKSSAETRWLDTITFFKKWASEIDYTSWQFWLGIFLSLNILATFTPSKADYLNIFWGAVIYLTLSYFFIFFNQINLILIYILAVADILLVIAMICLTVLNLLKIVFKFL